MLISLALAIVPTWQEPVLVRPPEEEPRRGWLLEIQEPDGRWDADGFTGHDLDEAGPGLPEYDVLATSLALWACLGDGRKLGSGPDADALARGVRWLLAAQNLDTGLVRDVPHDLELGHHAIATVVLCDFQALEPGPLVRDACDRAVAALVRAQAPGGSWGDARTTAWALLAFASARAAGLDVPAGPFAAGEAWLRSAEDTDFVAAGLDVLRELTALAPGDERGELVARGRLAFEGLASESGPRDGEAWFVATALGFRLGGASWKDLQRPVRAAVLDTQRRGGELHGSWDPRGAPGGRIVETSWYALTLEIYFRYAMIFPAR